MGNRANVFVKDQFGVGGVFLYTHSGGDELPLLLQTAIRRGRERWQVASYLARIIFCDMVRDDLDGMFGHGISASLGDNGHPILAVEVGSQSIVVLQLNSGGPPTVLNTFTFEDYVALNLGDDAWTTVESPRGEQPAAPAKQPAAKPAAKQPAAKQPAAKKPPKGKPKKR